MSRNARWWIAILGVVGFVGCDTSNGPRQTEAEFSRDIDQQVDSVLKDFKNE